MIDQPSAPHRLARISARIGWRVLLFANVMGLVAGVVEAVVWAPTGAGPTFDGTEGYCSGGRQPPCFDLPDITSMPLPLVPLLPYALALVVFLALTLPSLVAGVWDGARGRWPSALRSLLTFAGPMVVFVGTEIVPHAVVALPCGVLDPDLCSRFHQLAHLIFGLVPMTLLYRSALLRWSPGVLR